MILEQVIKQVADDQQKRIEKLENGLIREKTLNLKSFKSHALIISGVRRCGKSTLMMQQMEHFENAFYLNFETPLLYGFSINDFERLDRIISAKNAAWLFFDEIQIIEGWERYVRQKLDEKYFVVITGSNASLLSKELGTKLTGRHINQELFPFSYQEFLTYKNLERDENSLMEYLNKGGFPEFIKTDDTEQLLQLFNDLIIRDIVVRHGIKDVKNLQLLSQFLISNVGNRITGNKLRQSFSIGANSTISKWFSYLEDTYLFSFVPVYKHSLKAQSINPHKVYAIDTGLIEVVSTNLQNDLGHKLENLVYLHLRRKYQQIFYFDEDGECDFIVLDQQKGILIIQVCLELNQDNIDRELNGIYKATKFFNQRKALIVTLGQKDLIKENEKMIHVIPVYDFLLDD